MHPTSKIHAPLASNNSVCKKPAVNITTETTDCTDFTDYMNWYFYLCNL